MSAPARLGASCKHCGARLVIVPSQVRPTVQIARDRLLFETSRATGVAEHDIAGRCRRSGIVFARHVALFVLRTAGGQSYPEAGALLGVDHTTVMSACRKIAALIESDGHVRSVVESVTRGVMRGRPEVAA